MGTATSSAFPRTPPHGYYSHDVEGMTESGRPVFATSTRTPHSTSATSTTTSGAGAASSPTPMGGVSSTTAAPPSTGGGGAPPPPDIVVTTGGPVSPPATNPFADLMAALPEISAAVFSTLPPLGGSSGGSGGGGSKTPPHPGVLTCLPPNGTVAYLSANETGGTTTAGAPRGLLVGGTGGCRGGEDTEEERDEEGGRGARTAVAEGPNNISSDPAASEIITGHGPVLEKTEEVSVSERVLNSVFDAIWGEEWADADEL